MTDGKALTASLIASPGNLMTTQGTMLKPPIDKASTPNLHAFRLTIEWRPIRMDDEIRDAKTAIEKRTCIIIKVSVNTPTPIVEMPTPSSPMPPTEPRILPRSIRMKEIANIDKSTPVMIRPELKIGATFDTPRSLRALLVQLNHGESLIEIPMEVIAHIIAMIPIHEPTFGSKTLCRLGDTIFHLFYGMP
jgi:hypothetical protein